MSDYETIRQLIDDNDIKFVDLRFTDPKGKFHHLTMTADVMDQDAFEEGVLFDGSSIAGWKAINESDMLLRPDLSSVVIDPFSAQPQINVLCDIVDPVTGEDYERDPRSTAKRVEALIASEFPEGKIFFGPEAEFFMFDDVKFDTRMETSFFELYSSEGPYASGDDFEGGNMGHRTEAKGGYFPVAPLDPSADIRAEMVEVAKELGLKMDKHHHEVAPAQHELGMIFDTLTKAADNIQYYKYVVHNVAASYGKSVTFMPKPIAGDNGSGMHCNQSIWTNGKPLFAGDGYAGLSETCLYYIGGIIKHAKALNAFTNPTTNSYKRLIPGFEAPVILAYSARNRSASVRIPFGSNPKAKRVEIRFPDPAANPYLAFSAQVMAGLDGIRNKIHPGEAMDKDLYELPAEELQGIPQVAGSLREALDCLAADWEFLTYGGVFTKDQIDSYIALKWQDVYRFEHAPHPIEFKMYYSC